MTKEILEGNKLIKDFYTNEHIRGQFGRILSADEYKYHFSWDWLMPVVEKINTTELNGESFGVIIFGNYCHINDSENLIFEVTRASINEPLVYAVWKAVVQFIHFYNTQSKVNK